MNEQAKLKEGMLEIVTLFQRGDFSNALRKNKKLLKKFPRVPGAYTTAGALCLKLGMPSEAIRYCRQALKLVPNFADAHTNLAAAYNELGDYTQGLNHCEEALKLNPRDGNALKNKGNALKSLGRLEDASNAYHHLLSCYPNDLEARFNLANLKREAGDVDYACESYKAILQKAPRFLPARQNLGSLYLETGRPKDALFEFEKILDEDRANQFVAQLYLKCFHMLAHRGELEETPKHLVELLQNKGLFRPSEFSQAIIAYLKKQDDFLSVLDVGFDIDNPPSAFCENELFFTLLDKALIVDPQLEQSLTKIRRALLLSHRDLQDRKDIVDFIMHLALACFNNEYVFSFDDKEAEYCERLWAGFSESDEPTDVELLILACYRDFSDLPLFSKCVEKRFPALFKRVVLDRTQETHFKKSIKSLSGLKNEVSQKVRVQYEENPYPRWQDTALYPYPSTFSKVGVQNSLKFKNSQVLENAKPEILIAGCGTGQHSLATASRFGNAKILAMDLSLSSIAYACRKTQEYGLKNIEYIQGDLLDVGKIGRKFDLVESVGVLHHMESPIEGWKALCDVLKPGGLMHIGLYSELARANVVAAREKIREQDLKADVSDIRHFRQEILGKSKKDLLFTLTHSHDFYSLSNCRDLLFHVQEHRYDMDTLIRAIKELGLAFAGFELTDLSVTRRFFEMHGKDADLYDLENWAVFEKCNPTTFAGMYQFWLQKPES